VFELGAIGGSLKMLRRFDPKSTGEPGCQPIEGPNHRTGDPPVDGCWTSERERRFEGPTCGHRLRNKLAKDHLDGGRDEESESDRDTTGYRAEDTLETRFNGGGSNGFREETEQQRRDRDAELGATQVIRDAVEQSLDADRGRAALTGTLVNAGPIDGHQREFGSNERGIGGHESEGCQQP
jgi:hypothetical protein